MNRKLNELDQVLGNILIYSDPDLFKIDKSQIKFGPRFNKKTLKKYQLLIYGINWCQKKISRYEVYFNAFYPNTKEIPKIEALEHHIHAYLEDLTTLKNKLTSYVGFLKNDLKKIVSNKKEINDALKWLCDKVDTSFNNVSKYRNPHRHRSYRFVDNYITDGEMANMLLNTDGFKKLLTEEGLKKLRQQKKDSFNEGKKYWSQNSGKNYKQVKGITNAVFGKTNGFLFKLLDIEPLDIEEFNKTNGIPRHSPPNPLCREKVNPPL